MNLKKLKTHLAVSAVLFLPVLAFAQIGIKNPIEANDLSDVVAIIVRAVRMVAIPFIVLAFMWSGWKFIVAQGSPDKLSSAKKNLTYVFIGALVILSAELLAAIVANTIKNA